MWHLRMPIPSAGGEGLGGTTTRACGYAVALLLLASTSDTMAQGPERLSIAPSPSRYGYAVERTSPTDHSGSVQSAVGESPLPGRVAPVNGELRLVQNSPESARRVHRLIESMPESQEEFELIERRSQLVIARANVVRAIIADPSIIDLVQYSPREFSIIGLGRGSTTLTLWFENESEPLIYLVTVIRDPALDRQRRIDYGKLEKKLQVLFPNSRVYLIPMSWKIIVRGQARDQQEAAHILQVIQGEFLSQDGSLMGPQPFLNNAAAAAGAGGAVDYWEQVGGGGRNGLVSSFIINELQVPGEFQVALRFRVAELSRTMARDMGIDWEVFFNDGRHVIGASMGGVAAGGSTLQGVFEDGEVGVFLNWLASNGTAKILAEPVVTVLSGREARFLSGGEFAVPTVVGIGGAAGQTTAFRGFGTSILVTPTVLDRDNIRLTCIAEYSDINQGNSVGGIPGTDARRVETTVELREGQTLALAGLLSTRTKTENSRIPFFGDIPKIGPLLFSSKTSSQDENELLIIVTPELVRPMDAHEVPPVPGFAETMPHDHEFYFQNATEGAPDTGYYQLPPYGSGSVGTNVGYQHFNPGPANSLYQPVPTNPAGNAYPPGGSPIPQYGTPGPQYGSPGPQYGAPTTVPQQTPPPAGAMTPSAAYPPPGRGAIQPAQYQPGQYPPAYSGQPNGVSPAVYSGSNGRGGGQVLKPQNQPVRRPGFTPPR
jgi:pilus assembly protein CpaC